MLTVTRAIKVVTGNKDQRNVYQKGAGGELGKKQKGKIVNNIGTSWHGDRWLLELVG